MKKLLLMFFAIVFGLHFASAQEGMVMAGFDFGTLINTNYGKAYPVYGAKFMYNAGAHYRLALVGTWASVNDGSDFTIELDNHFFLSKVQRFRPYFILGIGGGKCAMPLWMGKFNYIDFDGSWLYDDTDYYDTYHKESCLLMRFGFGIDIRFASFLSMQIEGSALGNFPVEDFRIIDYNAETMFQGAQIKVGLTYDF